MTDEDGHGDDDEDSEPSETYRSSKGVPEEVRQAKNKVPIESLSSGK